MAKKMTIEQLAAMIQNTMASKEDLKPLATKEDLHTLEQKVDAGFQHVNSRLDSIRDDISDVPAMREEVHDLRRRVEHLDQKAGRTQ